MNHTPAQVAKALTPAQIDMLEAADVTQCCASDAWRRLIGLGLFAKAAGLTDHGRAVLGASAHRKTPARTMRAAMAAHGAAAAIWTGALPVETEFAELAPAVDLSPGTRVVIHAQGRWRRGIVHSTTNAKAKVLYRNMAQGTDYLKSDDKGRIKAGTND